MVSELDAAVRRTRPASARWSPALAVAAVGAIVLATYGAFLLHGGFVADDWSVQEDLRHGYAYTVSDLRAVLGTRPVMWILQPLPYVVFGTIDATPHIILAFVIAVATAAAAYRFLTTVGLERGHA